MAKIGFLEESVNVKSSTRLNILLVLMNGLIVLDSIIFAGIYEFIKSQGDKISLMNVCLAGASIFTSIIIPIITWKSISKSQEPKDVKIINSNVDNDNLLKG